MRMSPDVGTSSPTIMRANVDLPEPLSPTMASVSPCFNASVTSLTALISWLRPPNRDHSPPKVLLRLFTLIASMVSVMCRDIPPHRQTAMRGSHRGMSIHGTSRSRRHSAVSYRDASDSRLRFVLGQSPRPPLHT